MSSVLYGRGTYRQGDVFRQRTATVSREIGDLADDVADLRAEVRSLASVVDEIKKAVASTVARLDAMEAALKKE
jgi:hypothetical protein